MKLSELENRLGDLCIARQGDAEIANVRRDSREIAPGDLYVALSGARFDGLDFAQNALNAGAVAIASEKPLPAEFASIPSLIVRDARAVLATAAHAVLGAPSEALNVIGITGTNGKTTTAYIVEQMLRFAGYEVALLGTVAKRLGGVETPSGFTTPEADDLARFTAAAREDGAEALVMEVSSHGLSQRRVDEMRFEVAAFANLSQDHLDFHGTMQAYGEAKAELFTRHNPRVSVINLDDSFGKTLAERLGQSAQSSLITVSANVPATIQAKDVSFSIEGIRATILCDGETLGLRSPLVGLHNLENLLLALGIAKGLNLSLADALSGLENAPGAPGRFERVENHANISVFVDYAHTPEALGRALAALRPLTEGRLICVFGCGGDRDEKKRPMMGAEVGRGADVAWVTSDNPRTEDPAAIVDAILPGLEGTPAKLNVDVDREHAIRSALADASSGDTVLIAGKGHETYQIVGTTKRDFDDRKIARAFFAAGEGA